MIISQDTLNLKNTKGEFFGLKTIDFELKDEDQKSEAVADKLLIQPVNLVTANEIWAGDIAISGVN